MSRAVAADPARYVEHITDESWTEHLRRFDRVTAADVALLERLERRHKTCRPPAPDTRLWLPPGKSQAWKQLKRRVNEARAA